MKRKPPRKAQEWFYSSHRESIVKALSSPGIRSNKKAHLNCGSSARMADNILCKKLFQAIGEWRAQLAAKELSPDNNNPIQTTVAANAFVQAIMMLRKTFIQDSVLMMEFHPCYPNWQLSIFSDPAYLSFKRDTL
ncbi:hypothetical protein [Absidia glauca]|uniref:Ndc10 domain-containing protein n=1 Tax=Absidia glauca TaxID=4829 RepID=A0A168PG81_ABSGL|nr:hypothetical protein [Absidia glauca]